MAVLLAVVVHVSTAYAATIRVPAEAETIQAGLDMASEGDTVLVAPGTYRGAGNHNLNFSATTSPDPKNLVLRSEAGATATIIDVEGGPGDERRGFIFITGEGRSSVVDGFTIINGWMSAGEGRGARHALSGGGMVFRFTGTEPTIRNCVIRNCRAHYSGGGLEAEFFARPLVENCVIAGNTVVQRGGGISIEFQADIELRNCLVVGNSAGVAGGGLAFDGTAAATTVIEGCTIASNRSALAGGVDVRIPASVQLGRSIVWRNCAENGNNLYVESSATLELTCSAVDTTAAQLLGTTTYTDCIFTDPLLCDPAACHTAPTDGGDFHVAENSPCLPTPSPCGALIGYAGMGCGPATPVLTTSWGGIKKWFDR